MQKIINKKMYNTETAMEIADIWNGLSRSDFRHKLETLYLTKNGEWFIHGDGGAMTKYSRFYGGANHRGEDITPFTPAEAYKWLESNSKTEVILNYFSNEIDEA